MSSPIENLGGVTEVKYTQLKNNQIEFEQFRQKVLDSTNDLPILEKVNKLIELCTDRAQTNSDNDDPKLNISKLAKNLNQLSIFLKNSDYVEENRLAQWCSMIYKALDVESQRYSHSILLFELILEATNHEPKKADEPAVDSVLLEAEQEFKNLAFSDNASVTEEGILKYLNDTLFAGNEDPLNALRSNVAQFGNSLLKDTSISVNDVKDVISNIIKVGIVENKDVQILLGFRSNKTILKEITDVLNIKLSHINIWKWPEEGLEPSFRRQLNGKCRLYAHSELLDTIFVHYIGTSFAVRFRQLFIAFTRKAWCKINVKSINEKREFYFGKENKRTTVEYVRVSDQFTHFFLTQLPKSIASGQPSYSYDDEDDDEDDDDSDNIQNNLKIGELRQTLLRILVTEVNLSKTLKRPHTILRSDFEKFGPSLSHTTIMTVMKFFGVSQVWLDFFQKFLSAPIKMNGETCTMKRGTLMSFSLSDLFGESVLFLLDYVVNKFGKGLFMYRMHDDFWIWTHRLDVMSSVWGAMDEFNKVMGLKLNLEKTGSITIGGQPDKNIPEGTGIKWGLIKLNPDYSFSIDQDEIDNHILEIKRQLNSTESILVKTKMFNNYVSRYLTNNFGEYSSYLGRDHLEDMIQTLDKINIKLFGSKTPVLYLQNLVEKRFKIKNVLKAWFYLPLEKGGLGIEDPRFAFRSIEVEQALQDKLDEKFNKKKLLPFELAAKKDEDEYLKCKEDFLAKEERKLTNEKYSVEEKDYPTFEEYTQNPEKWLLSWKVAYEKSCSPLDLHVALPDMKTGGWNVSTDIRKVQECVIESIYGEEMIEKWGQMVPILEQYKPSGIIEMWKKEKSEWII